MRSLEREGRRLARMLRLSLELLAAHRLRTALSVSGLTVGVATVIVMVAAGKGAERKVIERVRALGTDLLVVAPAQAPSVAGRRRQVSTTTVLRIADAEAISQESGLVVAAAAAVNRTFAVRVGDRNANVSVFGTTTDGLRIRRIRARAGRAFEENEDHDRRRVALIGPTVARTLFEGADPIGREIRIGSVPFEVIGIMEARGTDVGGSDLDNEIVLPLQTAMRRLFNIPYVHAILVQASESGRLDDLEGDVRDILSRRHPARTMSGNVELFVFQNQAELLRREAGVAGAISGMVVAVAALALVVGGIGIVAVMLLDIRHRTREIGLRRAVGARARDIQIQFLLEAAILATAGGTLGIVAGFLIAGVAALFGSWDLVIPWGAGLAALLVTIVLGLSVGTVPAVRAARLEPNVALRA